MATANQGERKTKGRQKIEIKKIENKSRLHVTFSKRQNGIFKKAQELHLRTGAEIAVFVRSPGNKIFAFGSPSTDSVIHHYINGPNSHETAKRKKPMGLSGESKGECEVVQEDGGGTGEFGGSNNENAIDLPDIDNGPITDGIGEEFGGTNGEVEVEVALDLMAPITEEDGATGEEFGGSTLDLLHGFDTWPITGEEGGGGIGELGGSTLDLLHGFDSWPITEEGGGGIGAFGGSNKDVALDLHCGLGSLPITEEGEGSMGTFGASNNDVALDLLRGLDSGPNTEEQEAATNFDDCMYLLDLSLLL